LRAINDSLRLGYSIHFWRTRDGHEVDFVMYGEHGFWAIEVKRSSRLRDEDFGGLALFGAEYPQARRILVYGGERLYVEKDVAAQPVSQFLRNLASLLPRSGA
jgi:uncharacterized protein